MQNSPSPEFGIRSQLARYGLAILAAVAAVLLRELLSPWLARSAPYLTLWTAVAFSSWYCGLGPSIAAAFTGVAGIWFFFFRAQNSLALRDPHIEIAGMIGFLVFASLIIALGEANRRARLKLDREVQERRHLTAESLATSAKFRAVFEQTSVFAGITTIHGTVIDANQLCLDACGYRSEQVLGKPLWQTPWWRLSGEVRNKIRMAIERAAQGTPYRETLIYHWADNSEHIVDFSLHPIHDPEGQVIFLHPTGVDITELKRTEEGLRKAHDELERRVIERTGELAETVVSLEAEMIERKKTEQDLRLLSARVLRLQDEERRRIARDLHDSTGQTLAALRMALGALERLIGSSPEAAVSLAEAQELANQALREIRTTSYLLHPPLLDEVGFASAARWYVEGFTSRSGIQVDLQLNPVPPLKKEFELALFRILQESLSNVHRHSESNIVQIQLNADAENTILSIRDFGKGMPPEKLASFLKTGAGVGVGLGGMKQRVRELGGHLRVESNGAGTCIIATLPLTEARFSSDATNPTKSQISAA
jgi:PAS domain S-box-containing protein